jgi:outer membrane protein assembly factor BamB
MSTTWNARGSCRVRLVGPALVIALVALVIAGCGSSSRPGTSATATATPSATPLPSRPALLFYSTGSTLYAVNPETGAQVWAHQGAAIQPVSAVTDELVYVRDGNVVRAINARTGAAAWSYTSPASEFTITLRAATLFIGSSPNDAPAAFIAALDAHSGNVLWQEQSDSLVTVDTASGLVLARSSSAAVVRKLADGTVLHSYAITDPDNTGAALLGGKLFLSRQRGTQIQAFDAASGAQLWQRTLAEYHAEVDTIAGNTLLVRAIADISQEQDFGTEHTFGLQLLGLDPGTGTQVWKLTLPGAIGVLRAVGGTVYLKASYQLYAVRATDGAVLWKTGAGLLGPIALGADGTLYTFGHDGLLSAIRSADGSVAWKANIVPLMYPGLTVVGNRAYASRSQLGRMVIDVYLYDTHTGASVTHYTKDLSAEFAGQSPSLIAYVIA